MYKNCRPAKQSAIILDQCMEENNMEGLKNKLNKAGGDVWSKVEYALKGFPYNLVDKEKEERYSCYHGGPLLLVTILYCILILYSGARGNASDKFGGGVSGWESFGWLIDFFVMPFLIYGMGMLVLVTWCKFESGPKTSIIIAALCAIAQVAGLFIGGNDTAEGNVFKYIIPSIVAIITFYMISKQATKKNGNGKNYSFTMAFVKFAYYVQRSFVKGFENCAVGSRRIVNKLFRFIGKLPISNWVYVIFGTAIIPLLIMAWAMLGIIFGIWSGFTGFFDPKPYKKIGKFTKCPETFGMDDKDVTKPKDFVGGGLDDSDKENDYNLEGGKFKLPRPTSEAWEARQDAKKEIEKEKFYKNLKSISASNIASGVKSRLSVAADITKKAVAKKAESIKKRMAENTGEEGPRMWSMGLFLMLFLIPIIFGFIFGFLNIIFQLFTYFFIPLTYPEIFTNIISCNIKSLIFVFGLGLMSALWHYKNKGTVFVPDGTLEWMTVTFCVITVFNMFTK